METKEISSEKPPRPNTSNSREEQIRKRAYELYLARKVGPGSDVQDWLRAEAENHLEVDSLDECGISVFVGAMQIREMQAMKVKDLMTTDVKSCRDYSTLSTAAQMMWEHDIGCVAIVDHENRVIGMLTDRDVCMSAYIQGAPLTGASVTSAMSKQVFSMPP